MTAHITASARRAADLDRGGREGMSKDFPGVVDEEKAELPPELLRHVFDITLVPAWQDHLADPGPVGGQHLLLDPPDGQDLAPQRDLPGHGHLAPDRPPG